MIKNIRIPATLLLSVLTSTCLWAETEKDVPVEDIVMAAEERNQKKINPAKTGARSSARATASSSASASGRHGCKAESSSTAEAKSEGEHDYDEDHDSARDEDSDNCHAEAKSSAKATAGRKAKKDNTR